MLKAKHYYGGQVLGLVLSYLDNLGFTVDVQSLERSELDVTFTPEFYDNLTDTQKEVLRFAFPEIKEARERGDEEPTTEEE